MYNSLDDIPYQEIVGMHTCDCTVQGDSVHIYMYMYTHTCTHSTGHTCTQLDKVCIVHVHASVG